MTSRLEIPEFLEYKYRHPGEEVDERRELPEDKIFGEVVAIMRANPPHKNHSQMLRTLCDKSVQAKINLGSSNRFGEKNPFKVQERADMIRLSLKGYRNFEVLELPDFNDDEAWFNHLYQINQPFTEVVSNNPYDLKIYEAHKYEEGHEYDDRFLLYDILDPTEILGNTNMAYVTEVKQDGKVMTARKPMYISGTFTRAAIVNDWNWPDFVDKSVAEYIKKNKLAPRLKDLCGKLKGISLRELEEDR